MENKVKKKTMESTLMGARSEALEQINNATFQAHEQLWGMNVFSWTEANIEESLRTIRELPNPVIWVMSADSKHDFSEDKLWLSHEVEAIISFGEKNKQLRYDLESNVAFYARKEDLTSALELLRSVANPGFTVFFSPGMGEDANQWNDAFKKFLKENK